MLIFAQKNQMNYRNMKDFTFSPVKVLLLLFSYIKTKRPFTYSPAVG